MKHAVYTGTRNLYRDMEVSAKSLIANSSVGCVHLLIEDGEFPSELPEMVDVIDVSYMSNRFSGPNDNSVFTYMAMARACYCELFPDVDRIVQLDCDTVCVDDVDFLWDVDLDGKWFAAVKEVQDNYKPYGPDYYNIGVASFNLCKMRGDGAQEKLEQLMRSKKMWCVEQDALNELAQPLRAIAELPARFNESAVTQYTDDPAIVHFASFGTTWHDNIRAPRREYYRKYRDMTWDEALERHHG